ncbi:GATS protein-like 3 [Mortierella claussenii]|nr:GATS protein-like 3 [Mortierella claussenii]
MIVDILPFRLKLASIEKSDIPRCTHQLMKLVLFPAGEVSLILDETHIPGFPEDTLNVCNVIWRAVQIEPGESGLGALEVVSQVSKPLADINVSIMQISTYDADFTLMPECDLIRALDCLANTFSISNDPLEDAGLQPSDLQSWEETFPMSPTEITSLQDALLVSAATTRSGGRRLSNLSLNGNRLSSSPPLSPALEGLNGHGSGDDSNDHGSYRHLLLDHHHPSDRHEDSGIGSEATSGPSSGITSGHGSHVLDTTIQGLDPSLISSLSLKDGRQAKRARHPFKANFPHRLHITSMEHGLMDQLAIRLLESIFFDKRDDRFFSFTQTDSTLSIIMDGATMSLFPDHTLNTQAGDWRLIAIGDGPLGFDECGFVNQFSRPLGEAGVGMFYLSTFSSDYIMVNDQDYERAVTCLHETAKTVLGVEEDKNEESSEKDGKEGETATRQRRRSSARHGTQPYDATSIRSIDTASVSGVSSDVEPAELSPVSTTADDDSGEEDDSGASRFKTEDEGHDETSAGLVDGVPA